MLPKISVVIISYNSADTIEESILSFVNQDYDNKELVIIDGSSDDGTIDIIEKYANHISYWVSEPDEGTADAYNKAFPHMTGDLVGILNSDDIYRPGILKEIAEAFDKHGSEYDIISCGASVIRMKDGKEINSFSKAKNIVHSLKNILFKHCIFNAHFYSLSHFKKYGDLLGHLEDGSKLISCDRYWQALVSIGGEKNYIIDKPLYVYKAHEDSLTMGRKNVIRVREEQIWIANKLAQHSNLSAEQKKIITSYYRHNIALLFGVYLLFGEPNKSWKIFKKGFRERKILWFYDLLRSFIKEVSYRLSVKKW